MVHHFTYKWLNEGPFWNYFRFPNNFLLPSNAIVILPYLPSLSSSSFSPPMKSAAAIMSGLTLSKSPPRSAYLSSYSPHRCFSFFSLSLPIYRSLNSMKRPPIHVSHSNPMFIVRNSSSSSSGSSSITAKPSSEMRKHHNGSSKGLDRDQKLTALRELFGKPGINIDAYIIPSQDAHQVWFSPSN